MPIDGFDDVIDSLDELSENLEEIDGENQVPIDELFNDSFMRKYTDHGSFEEFIEKSPWTVESEEDLEAIPKRDMDEYVMGNTRFSSTKEMEKKATEEWTGDQLGI